MMSEWYQTVQQVPEKNDGWEEDVSFHEQRVICNHWNMDFKVAVETNKQLQVIEE